MTPLVSVAIHRALVTPILVAGAEREYSILIGLMAVLIWVAGKSLIAFLLALSLWCMGIMLGRYIAKRDAQGLKIWLRHMRYADYYPATEKQACHIRSIEIFKV